MKGNKGTNHKNSLDTQTPGNKAGGDTAKSAWSCAHQERHRKNKFDTTENNADRHTPKTV